MPSTLNRVITLPLVCLIALGLALATPSTARAAVIVVDTFQDQNGGDTSHCSLREAVISVNTNKAFGGCPKPSGAGDIIVLSEGTYTVSITGQDGTGTDATKGDIDILKGVYIMGAGPGRTVIKAASGLNDRIFHVKSASLVSISNLTIDGGNVTSYSLGNRLGGGIFNDVNSQLSLQYVTVSNNTAEVTNGSGGRVANFGTLYINGSTFAGNKADVGGAIYNLGLIDIVTSVFTGNRAITQGGGIDHRPNQLAVHVMTVTNSTFYGNNSANGAALASAGKTTLRNVTVGDNTGTAIYLHLSAELTVQNTLIVNGAGNNCAYADAAARVNTKGYNLENRNQCRLGASTDKRDLSSKIFDGDGKPADNGGPTATIALYTGGPNPAVNVIPLLACPGTDQRMLGRGGPACDIGAYEDGAIPLPHYVHLPAINR